MAFERIYECGKRRFRCKKKDGFSTSVGWGVGHRQPLTADVEKGIAAHCCQICEWLYDCPHPEIPDDCPFHLGIVDDAKECEHMRSTLKEPWKMRGMP